MDYFTFTGYLDSLYCVIKYSKFHDSYQAFVYNQKPGDKEKHVLLLYRVFGNGVSAENWLLDVTEYPSLVYLQAKL